jgi:hypothetical protein
MLNTKMIFSFVFTTLVVMQGSVECVMFDWMMPNFLSHNQENFGNVGNMFGQEFQNGMLSLQNSMNSLKSNMENMNIEFKNIRNRTYTIDDLASVISLKDNENSSYHNTGGCSCVNLTCLCCAHLEIDQLDLNQTACLSLTYLSSDAGVRTQFSVNNVTYFNQTISVSNPPPACVNVPEFEEAASLCLIFYDMILRNSSLSGCLDVIAKLAGAEVARLKVSCFQTAPNSKFYQQNIITSRKSGNVINYNQFNSDSNLNPNLVLQKVSIINDNLFSSSSNSLLNSWSNNWSNNRENFFFTNPSRFNAFNNFKRDAAADNSAKRHKRD